MARIDVRKFPVDPGPAGWNAILPAPPQARALAADVAADWLIIGAGFAGLAAARRLTQLRPGDRVVVLDATRIADGPAGRNSGFMIDLPHDLASADYAGGLDHDRALTADNRHAIDFAADMAADYGLGADVFARAGKINGAATARGHAHNMAYASHLARLGEPAQLLDAAAMRGITGTDYYQSGLKTPGSAIIQPAAFIRGIADGLKRANVEIYENSPVQALAQNHEWCATTPGGTVRASRVIMAVNGHLNSFGFLARRLMHVFTYASMTRVLSPTEAEALGGRGEWHLTPADPMGTTVRKIETPLGVRILIRNRFTFDQDMEVSNARIHRVARDHDRSFKARFPMLNAVEMEYRWGGRLCLSRNNVGVLAELSRGMYAACCQNGLGTTRGTLLGLLAVELALGKESERLERIVSAQPPTKLPPEPVASLAANAFLRMQEWRAGREL